MFDRVISLSLLVPSLNPLNVWDLPLWSWRSYAAVVDEHERQMREAAKP